MPDEAVGAGMAGSKRKNCALRKGQRALAGHCEAVTEIGMAIAADRTGCDSVRATGRRRCACLVGAVERTRCC